MIEATIYHRNAETENRYKAIEEGPGIKTSTLAGPFYIRISVKGIQKPYKLDGDTFAAAKAAIPALLATLEAKRSGLTVAEDPENNKRVSLRAAVDHFLAEKTHEGATPATMASYTATLKEFLELLPGTVYLDQIVETKTSKGIAKRTSSILRNYKLALEEKGLSPRTVYNKLQVVIFMLKEAGITKPSELVALPDWETEEAVPYSAEDLRKLFKAMDPEDHFLFSFFLDSACRKAEVAHAQWSNIVNGKYHVRAKEYTMTHRITGKSTVKKFTVKNHEDRLVPLTNELLQRLEERRKTSKSKWIFPNEEGNPNNDNGFIRRLRYAARDAGLICGHCQSEIKKTDRWGQNPRIETVSCADNCTVCEQHYLHRLRKTCATIWHNTGVPVRTIQKYLGHKSLETTMIYLGVQDSEELTDLLNKKKY